MCGKRMKHQTNKSDREKSERDKQQAYASSPITLPSKLKKFGSVQKSSFNRVETDQRNDYSAISDPFQDIFPKFTFEKIHPDMVYQLTSLDRIYLNQYQKENLELEMYSSITMSEENCNKLLRLKDGIRNIHYTVVEGEQFGLELSIKTQRFLKDLLACFKIGAIENKLVEEAILALSESAKNLSGERFLAQISNKIYEINHWKAVNRGYQCQLTKGYI